TSELAHILATQVMALRRPKSMLIRFEGKLAAHVTAKDVALRIIAELGVAGARGHVVEYAGAAVRAMTIESRITLCTLNIEMGGRSGFVAPDESAFSWIEARPFAPKGAMWDRALAHWRTLTSDDGAEFDREHVLDCSALEPQITWGTDPSQVLGISGRVPDPAAVEQTRRAAIESALAYMGLQPGMALAGLPVDRVFIGSCTNSRLPDLKAAADVVCGRHVAEGVIAMVVPGSTTVKRAAEAAGLDRVFREAGFLWGESGCSMCAGGNGDRGEPGERCVSTTNRNFEHRQGPKVRTHRRPPRPPPSPGASPTCDSSCRGSRDAAVHDPYRHRRPAHQGRHQHRPDRAGAIDAEPQARLQGAVVHARAPARRRQRGPRLRAQPTAVPRPRHSRDRPQFRRRLLARGGGVGNAGEQHPRHRREELCRHLSRELPAERLAPDRTGS